jgi:hypothetical protein
MMSNLEDHFISSSLNAGNSPLLSSFYSLSTAFFGFSGFGLPYVSSPRSKRSIHALED